MYIFCRFLHVINNKISYLLILVLVITIISTGSILYISKSSENSEKDIPGWVTKKFDDYIGRTGTDVWQLLKYIYINVDLLASVQQLQPVLKDIVLTGLDISLIRLSTGKFQLIKSANQHTPTGFTTNWYKYIFLLNDINLDAISVHYIDLINTNLSGYYQFNNVFISHIDMHWITKAKIQLPDKLGSILTLHGEMEWFAETSQMHWRYRLRTVNLLLQQLLRQNSFQGMQISQGGMTVFVNVNGIDSKVSDLDCDLVLKQANLVASDKIVYAEDVLINKIKGFFAWHRKKSNWRFTGKDIELDINNYSWPVTSFMVEQYEVGHLFVEADYIRLSDLRSVMLLTYASPWSLQDLKLAGDMMSMRLEYNFAENYIHSVKMTLENFESSPWGGVPGINGFSGSINWHNNITTIYLDSHNMTLNLDKWLKKSIFFNTASGYLRWQYDQNWQIEVSELRLCNNDFALQFDGTLKHNNRITDANFKIKLNHVNIKNWQQYIPRNLLSRGLESWFSSALMDGNIIDGDISLTGNLADFPFESKPEQGQYDMTLNVENIILNYAPNWPKMTITKGTVTGNNNLLTIKSKRGNISGFCFSDVVININNYIDGRALLMANMLLTGTTQQALSFLQHSPLKLRFRNMDSIISATGESNVKLAITVPLLNTDDTKVHGYIDFNKSEFVNLKCLQFKLSDVTGKVQFNNIGILAKDIKAKLLDQDVNINISSEGSKIAIYLNGILKISNLDKAWNEVLPRYISGQTAYKAKLSVYEKILGQIEVDVTFESDLIGIGIDMPAPLGKKKYRNIPFSLSIEYRENVLSYFINYDDKLHAVIVPGLKNQDWRGEICFGGERAIIPNAGMVIKGKLDRISIDDWLSWKESRFENVDNSILKYIDVISIYISQIKLYDQQIAELLLTANREDKNWLVRIYSNQVTGDIIFPHDSNSPTSLFMDFDYIYLETPKNNNLKGNSIENSIRRIDLSRDINFHVQRLYFGNIQFGEITLLAVNRGISWDVDALIFNPATIYADIQGQWQKLPTGRQSYFNITIDSNNFHKLLTDLGYRPTMEADKVNMKIELTWPDSPTDFSRNNIVGDLIIKVGKGRMMGINIGTVGRMFGLLSVASIPRLLSLDFTSLFDKNINFMSINGKFGLSDGIAYTDYLSMTGQSMNIDVIGSINIIKETYNQILTITPNISSTLPVAGAVVGGSMGLGIGTMLLIIDRVINELFGKGILNLISYSHRLTGAWYNPKLNIINPILK